MFIDLNKGEFWSWLLTRPYALLALYQAEFEDPRLVTENLPSDITKVEKMYALAKRPHNLNHIICNYILVVNLIVNYLAYHPLVQQWFPQVWTRYPTTFLQ